MKAARSAGASGRDRGGELGTAALVAIAAALLVAGAAVLALASSPLRFAFAAPLLLTGALCGLAVARPPPTRVTTDARGIEVVGIEGRRPRRLGLEEIRGIRTLKHRGGSVTVVLEPRDAAKRPLELPALLLDANFWGWARTLPDLDALDAARVEAGLLASPALGATPAARRAALGRARSVARGLGWSSIVAGGWALAEPSSPWAVAAAFLFPATALVVALLGGGAFQHFRARNDPRPTLWMALIVPVGMASIRVFEYQLVMPGALLPPALAGGAALAALAAAGDRSLLRRPLQLAGLFALMTGLSASGLTFANGVRDGSALVEFEATLLSKYRTRRTPTLALGPWERRPGRTVVFVPRPLYDSVEQGTPVRICLRAGRLGLPWFWLSPGVACPDSRPPTM